MYSIGDIDITDLDELDIGPQDDESVLLSFSEYDPYQRREPTGDQWRLPTLTKKDKKGSIRTWLIGFDGRDTITVHGQADGKKIVDKDRVKLNTRSKDHNSQAWTIISQKYKLKIRKGYVPVNSNLQGAMQLMRGDAYTTKTKLNWPVIAEYKLDGFRCAIYMVDSNVIYKSRQGRELNILYFADDMFIKLFSYLPPGCMLDCEIYNHNLTFEETQSILSTRTHVHDMVDSMQFFIFDICTPNNMPMELRRSILEEAFQDYYGDTNVPYDATDNIKLKSTDYVTGDITTVSIGCNPTAVEFHHLLLCNIKLIYDRDSLDEMFQQAILDRYEGLMIKRLSNGAKLESMAFRQSTYHRERCTHILKYKDVKTSEGVCIAVHNDSKGREAGCGILEIEMDDNQYGKRTFRLKMAQPIEKRREYVEDPDLVVGKVIEFKFQDWTSAGIPRFGVGLRVRDLDVS